MQRQGCKVICYFSAGSLEDWGITSLRSQKAPRQPLDGWAGGNWLDIRDKQVRRVMQNRIKLAAKKDCHSVYPKNVDGYQNGVL